ncbi:hypothetical protein KSP39_PZI000935 [Platanthera zijinensis]|uniref:Uncharacterized protein n=1 Tax=Platanthera zijinensis TaxID=2320716 RepID=A0AAP0C1W2_9ASPA
MEEVWKEINMSTLGHYCHPSPPSLSSVETPLPHYKTIEPADHHSFHGMSLPDFLTGPFKDPRCSAATGEHRHHSLPPTALSLCSSGLVPDFDYQNFHSCLPASNSDSACPGHVAAAIVDAGSGSHFLCSRKRVCDTPSSCNTLRSAMGAQQPKWKSLQKSFSALF